VARSAAGLSYYLTLSIFPFLICLSVILGSFNIHEMDSFMLMQGVIPDAAFRALTDFLEYISNTSQEIMLTIGITAMFTSSSAAFRSFISITGEIQGKMRFSGIMGWIISFIFSIVFLIAIYASALVVLSGEWMMNFINTYFDMQGITTMWTWIRFVLLFLLLFSVIYGVYMISAPKNTKRMSRLPGALTAAIIIVAASMLFSQLITASIRYELLYGSLASFIILMLWLYLCSMILIMANVINIAISNFNEVKKSDKFFEAG